MCLVMTDIFVLLVYWVSQGGSHLKTTGIAQSCSLGNQAEFVLRTHMSTNQQQHGKNISRVLVLWECPMDYNVMRSYLSTGNHLATSC